MSLSGIQISRPDQKMPRGLNCSEIHVRSKRKKFCLQQNAAMRQHTHCGCSAAKTSNHCVPSLEISILTKGNVHAILREYGVSCWRKYDPRYMQPNKLRIPQGWSLQSLGEPLLFMNFPAIW